MSFGRFSQDDREYVITARRTPRPWLNYLSNDQYCVIVSQTGAGFSFYRAAHAFRVTYHVDDGYTPRWPVSGRFLYARDRESGRCWTVNPQPAETGVTRFSCRQGLGYAVWAAKAAGIEGRLRIFVPPDDPVELWTARLVNRGAKPRRLSLFPYVEWHLSNYPATFTDPYVYAAAAHYPDLEVLHCRNTNPENLIRYGAFAAADRPLAGFDTSRQAFLGAYGTPLYPAAVRAGRCTGSVADAEKMAGALQVDLELPAGGEAEVNFMLGVAWERAEIEGRLEKYMARRPEERAAAAAAKFEAEFARLRAHWDEKLAAVGGRTPEPRFDRYFNVWSRAHVTNTARWTRGLDRGYRDVLQDLRGYLPLSPGWVRRYLVATLRHQYASGEAMRQWSEIGGPHDLRNYKDSPSWIPETLAGYVKETGDAAILEERVPWFDGGEGTVYEHARRAVETLYADRGAHRLCRMGHGDWNDSLNEIGRKGRGESVWLTCALVAAMQVLRGLADFAGDGAYAAELARRVAEVQQAINDQAWDGDWYVYAFNDDGQPVGSAANAEGRIHLNVQTWAIATGTATGERLARLLKVIDEVMDTEVGPVLIHPAYTRYDPGVGRITGMCPGAFENGSVYCHGATFKIWADAVAGRGDRAVETYLKVLPTNPANPPERSTVEPYGVTNFYLGPANPNFGRALYSYMTAVPGWFLRLGAEHILGVRPGYRGLEIDPCVPRAWKRFQAWRRIRGAEYQISFRNPKGVTKGVAELRLDGARLQGREVPYFSAGRHKVEVLMG